ncbi:MAG: AraC family transcriptional regulator [Gammaproteobacteria bacterium]|jgi:AraC-like DNA-binding protein|nr:AraC family transcriptional regulator [Gammaproteobacteria bacterium]
MIRGTWSLTEPLVPVNIPATMIRVGAEKGITSDVLLQNTGISPEQLSDPSARLTYQQMLLLAGNLMRDYPDETLGLDLGKAININQFGMLGYAILSCADLRSALRLGLKYHSLVDPAFTFEVVDQGDTTAVRLTSHIPFEHMYRLMCDVFIAIFATLARFLTGKEIDAREVHLNHPMPGYADEYQHLFNCPVLFDQPRTEFIIDSVLLDTPLAMADRATAAMAESQCEEILARMGPKEGIVAKVRRILLSNPGTFPPVDVVASHLATSTRTLSRSLQDVGTSYQRILDEVRKEMAIEYLRNSSLPIEEIAALVGYSDPSNFRKAFRRWTQHAPSYYREERGL